MNWEIKTKSEEVSKGLDILLIPANDVLRFVILQYNVSNLPKLLCQVSNSMSTGIEYVHIMNYAEMDWEDKAWAKTVKGKDLVHGEMFLVHDVMGQTIIKEAFFDRILFDYCSKILEVYQSDISLPKTWKEGMIAGLKKLESKISNEDSKL